MKNVLIIKIGALGDVVRTTAILKKFKLCNVTWFTSNKAKPLLNNNPYISRVLTETSINDAYDRKYDIILNMDEAENGCKLVSGLLKKNMAGKIYGYYMQNSSVHYNGKDTEWLDISLSGKFSKKKALDSRWKNRADELKWLNRRTYEDHMFSILGFKFNGEKYILSCKTRTRKGIVGIQNPLQRNTKWPMKRWNKYDELAKAIQEIGYQTKFLEIHEKLEDHITDIAECEYIICEDSLPMQIAIALRKQTIALFICTSPYEIYGHGIVTKIVSSKLKEYFYRRDFDPYAASTISLDTVLNAFKKLIQR